MQKWEYATVPLLVHATKQILDNWGEDGWELVAVVPGPNPEQLVAIAWSASFASSLKHVADIRRIKLHADVRIYANVELSSDDQGYVVGVRLDIYLPGLDREIASALVEAARLECPYCRATHGNIHAFYNLV